MSDELPESDESFAAMFEQSLQAKRRTVRPGEKVSGRVVQVGAQRVLLDLGDGLDGMIELSDLAERGETAQVKVGDRLEAFVLRAQDRVVELVRVLGKGPAAKLALEEAGATGVPVEGHVTAINKGGYVVEIAGTRCFCPLGQMDLRRIDDPATMIGKKLLFRVAEYRGGKDVVLSRRALLEAEQAVLAEKTRARLAPGARFRGTVTSVREFGAFVDLGGVEGLVHVSELAFGRQRVQDVVRVGQEVEVEVLRLEPADGGKSERISLSMRSLVEDPWDATIAELPEGTIVEGTVTRLQPFGAFVELVPGVEGLLHVSAFGRRIAHPSDVVREGETIAVRIDSIDREARRIGLSFVDAAELAEITGEPAAELELPAVAQPPKVAAAPSGVAVRRSGAPARRDVPVEAADAPPPRAVEGAKILGMGKPKEKEEPPHAEDTPRPFVRPPAPREGEIFEVTVDKIESFGLFVTFSSGRGLVPASELGVPRNSDLRRSHPVGTTFRAIVLEVRGDGKVRLSKTAAEAAEERAEAQAWMQQEHARGGGKSLGTFGDLLKGKLKS